MEITLKKKTVYRALIGFPIGVSIGYAITILLSFIFGGGGYEAVHPDFAAQVGSQINAVALQFFLCGVLGAACGSASSIWEVERWSLLKQTALHFVVLAAGVITTGYTCHWIQHTAAGVLQYIGIFLLIYIAIWLGLFRTIKKNVEQINKKLRG